MTSYTVYLDKEFFLNVQESIPGQYWSLFVDPQTKKTFWHLRNSIYCQSFWVSFIRSVVVPSFAKQNMIDYIPEIDLTLPVMIDRSTLELISGQGEFGRILYYNQVRIKDNENIFSQSKPYIFEMFNLKMDNIFALYLTIVLVVVVITLIFYFQQPKLKINFM